VAQALHDAAREKTLRVYGGSDHATTSDGGDFTVHAVVGLDPEGRMYLLDLRKQASSDEWVESFCDLVKRWKSMGWAEETGQTRSGVGPVPENGVVPDEVGTMPESAEENVIIGTSTPSCCRLSMLAYVTFSSQSATCDE
jgi:hypothetical protein